MFCSVLLFSFLIFLTVNSLECDDMPGCLFCSKSSSNCSYCKDGFGKKPIPATASFDCLPCSDARCRECEFNSSSANEQCKFCQENYTEGLYGGPNCEQCPFHCKICSYGWRDLIQCVECHEYAKSSGGILNGYICMIDCVYPKRYDDTTGGCVDPGLLESLFLYFVVVPIMTCLSICGPCIIVVCLIAIVYVYCCGGNTSSFAIFAIPKTGNSGGDTVDSSGPKKGDTRVDTRSVWNSQKGTYDMVETTTEFV